VNNSRSCSVLDIENSLYRTTIAVDRKVGGQVLTKRWVIVGLLATAAVVIVLVIVYGGGGTGGGTGGGGY
jgi:hypothetical protein